MSPVSSTPGITDVCNTSCLFRSHVMTRKKNQTSFRLVECILYMLKYLSFCGLCARTRTKKIYDFDKISVDFILFSTYTIASTRRTFKLCTRLIIMFQRLHPIIFILYIGKLPCRCMRFVVFAWCLQEHNILRRYC